MNKMENKKNKEKEMDYGWIDHIGYIVVFITMVVVIFGVLIKS